MKSIVSVNVGSDQSYEPLAVMFSEILKNNPAFSDVNLMFEYRLIDHSGFCDLVIIGQKNNIPCAYIVELKEWKGRPCIPFKDKNDKAVKEKILYNGNTPKRHPAAQVKDYVDSCRKKHSAITSASTLCEVRGSVFFPCLSNDHLKTYMEKPNEKLTEKYPVFNKIDDLAKDILSFIDAPAPEFFKDFSKGTYSQSYDLKSWAENALRTFMNDGEAEKPFNMIDAQGDTYDAICSALDKAIKDQGKEKKVFIIEGKPGTGKTAVAVNLLLYGLQKTLELNNYTQNVLFASSSTNEKTWQNTFSGKECKNLMVPASMFNPGMNSTTKNTISQEVDRNEEFKKLELFEKELSSTGERVFRRDKWREVWRLIRENKIKACECKIKDNMYFKSVAPSSKSVFLWAICCPNLNIPCFVLYYG
ncbi:MAG: DUF2075 domain-containing protein [Akkermansia sp.]|nr:DUF2075 domain-containing protein [Akkermansia sp.]